MTNANAAKGKRWEKAVLDFLRALFGRARVLRPHQEGFIDVGDLHLDAFALQLKDEARITLASYVDDAEKQAKAAELPFGAAVVKRRGKGTGRAYVVMSLDTFARVAERLHRAEELLARHAPEAYFEQHVPKNEPTEE